MLLIIKYPSSERKHKFVLDKDIDVKKEKINRKIQLKVLSIFKANPNKTFNYKQIAARLEFSDKIPEI